jgi:ATP-dependent RNA helicase RhlE
VVNYDVPMVPLDYVHRVGRTARMEAEGEAITFVSSEEENDLHGIEKILGKKIPRVTLPDFDYKALPPPKVRGREGGRPPRDSRGGGGRPRWRRGPPHR